MRETCESAFQLKNSSSLFLSDKWGTVLGGTFQFVAHNEYPVYGHSKRSEESPQFSGDLALRRDDARDNSECTCFAKAENLRFQNLIFAHF